MNKKYLLSALLGLGFMPAGAATAIPEPDNSLMASGSWVKIKVYDDAVYEMSYDRLRELGFANPESVNVYGYSPTLLLTHDFSSMPTDMTPVYTVHSAEQQKIVFYAKGDTEFAPELWQFETQAKKYLHKKHAHSLGATYLLSDVSVDSEELPEIAAPEVTESTEPLTTHTSLVYHEDEVAAYGEGGFWIAGRAINANMPSETHEFTVSKVASGSATMVYKCLMSNATRTGRDFFVADYSGGIIAAESAGSTPDPLAPYESFNQSVRFQSLTLPAVSEPATYSVKFSVHPQASRMNGNCALDFFGLRYERNNDMADEAQARMYFENTSSPAVFALSGIDNIDDWHVWDVTNFENVRNFALTQADGGYYGQLEAARANYPNAVIAFDVTKKQHEPEVVGKLENQNLHALSTPDLVIVTSKLLLPSAEKIAAIHRKHQNLDVVVVDQQKVFNEYGSGNVSPEAVRRFLRHLYIKEPGKLRGLLLLGPATSLNCMYVNDENVNVVSAQTEDYSLCASSTGSYSTDTFFGRFGDRLTTGSWITRVNQLQLFANKADIAVGRVPLTRPADIDAYYSKVEEYLSNPPAYPAMGNVVLGSDYAGSDNEEPHLNNSEAMVDSIQFDGDKTITITRAASNLISSKDNVIVRRILNSSFEQGSMYFIYFGHGMSSSFGGSNAKTQFFFDMQDASAITTPGRYPFMFIGSCNVAAFDKSSNTITHSFLANPKGGSLGIIASSREVFQNFNEYLGRIFTGYLMRARDGEWIGDVWCRAQSYSISGTIVGKSNMVNHMAYNLMGDPALPVYAATHKVAVNPVADNTLYPLAKNRFSGSVLTQDGSVDTDFNGMVTLTFYDAPIMAKNVFTPSSLSSYKYKYYAEIETDQDVIGQVTGNVVNGQFDFDAVAPVSSRQGTHRIQFYAWSSDKRSRALGCLTDVVMASDAVAAEPGNEMSDITSFYVAEGEAPSNDRVVLKAEISAPAGLAPATAIINPVRLTLDGSAISAQRMLTVDAVGKYSFEYLTSVLAGGKHEVTLSVLDANGQWIDKSIQFVVSNVPEAALSVAVDGEIADFEVASAIAADARKRLVIERLNGDLVVDTFIEGKSVQLSLEPGVYRAYVQLRSDAAACSTPKIEVCID